MGQVNVEVSMVEQAIKICKQSIDGFRKASGGVEKKCQEAGTAWKDDKYKQLQGIVQDCSKALQNPIKELEDCIEKLTALKAVIIQYEQTNVK